MSMTEDIADFVVSFSLNAAPAELLPRVREAFLDSFGVMLAGSREESAQIAARWVRDQGNDGKCTVFAQKDLHAAPSNAALANGVAAHTLDYDHFGHQNAVMVPCVLAAGEQKDISGRELIEAYIVGVEVSTLLAKGLGSEAHALGLHPAGVCGSLGAAAAAARILGLEPRQIQVALGIAASLTSGAEPKLWYHGQTPSSGQRGKERCRGGGACSNGIYGKPGDLRSSRRILRRTDCCGHSGNSRQEIPIFAAGYRFQSLSLPLQLAAGGGCRHQDCRTPQRDSPRRVGDHLRCRSKHFPRADPSSADDEPGGKI